MERRGAGARRQPLGRVRHRCRQRLPRRRASLLAASATSLTPSLARLSNRFRRLAPHAPVDGRSEWSRTKEGRTRRAKPLARGVRARCRVRARRPGRQLAGRGDRRGNRARLRVPLDPRGDRRVPRRGRTSRKLQHRRRSSRKRSRSSRAYDRNKFLELSTLGLGAVIGGIVTLPILGFAVVPAFVNQELDPIDLGPLDNYPEGTWIETKYISNPAEGEVSRRTVYVRNNGELRPGVPSFTLISNRCVHLGCPVQASGPRAEQETNVETEVGELKLDRGHAGRLQLPLPRRRLRHRGQPHCRPARPRARPLRVLRSRTTACSCSRCTPWPRSRARARDAMINALRPRRARASTSTARRAGSTRSRPRTSRADGRRHEEEEAGRQDGEARDASAGLARGALRASSAASSTSSSARSRATRAGGTPLAPQR